MAASSTSAGVVDLVYNLAVSIGVLRDRRRGGHTIPTRTDLGEQGPVGVLDQLGLLRHRHVEDGFELDPRHAGEPGGIIAVLIGRPVSIASLVIIGDAAVMDIVEIITIGVQVHRRRLVRVP